MKTNMTSIATSRRQAGAAASNQHDKEPETASTSMDSPAWDLILQHGGSSVRRDVPTVCALLCCSKAMRAAVSEHCAGQLDVAIILNFSPKLTSSEPAPDAFRVHPSQTEQLSAWVAKHGRLLWALDLRAATDGSQASFAAALAAAAAGPAVAQAATAAEQEPQQQHGQQQGQQQPGMTITLTDTTAAFLDRLTDTDANLSQHRLTLTDSCSHITVVTANLS